MEGEQTRLRREICLGGSWWFLVQDGGCGPYYEEKDAVVLEKTGEGVTAKPLPQTGAGFWNRGYGWRRQLFSSTPVLHAHQARQSRSCAWLSPGSGGDALSPRPLPSPERGVTHAQQSHPEELTAPLPTSAFLSRGDVRMSSLRRGALAHL